MGIIFILVGCIPQNNVRVIYKPKTANQSVEIYRVKVLNNQIIISGKNLNHVSEFKIKKNNTTNTLEIESQSDSTLVANTLAHLTIAINSTLELVLSTANGATNYVVDFSLCDAVLGTKALDCVTTPNDGEVLTFDASSNKWIPKALISNSFGGLFKGTFDPLAGYPSMTGLSPGDYFISTAINGNYQIGDLAIYNGTGFNRLPNLSAVVKKVFNRTGDILATKGDYNLNLLADVDLSTPPANGDFLKFNGTNWVSTSFNETDPTVSAFAKRALPTCGAGEVLKSNGVNLSCVTDLVGTGLFPATANRVITTDSSGNLTVSSVSNTELGYLSGTTSSIQTQLDGKERLISTGSNGQYLKGNKSWGDLGTDILATVLTGYSTGANVVLSATDTILSGFQKLQGQIATTNSNDGNKLSKNTSDSITALITVSGAGDILVPSTPAGLTSVVNKSYVDNLVANGANQWTASSNDIYRSSGKVGIGMTPLTTLDVNGGVRVGSAAVVTVTCNSTNEGIMRYNYTTHMMEYCDSQNWIQFVKQNAGVTTTVQNIGPPVGANVYTFSSVTSNYTPAFGSIANTYDNVWQVPGAVSSSNSNCVKLDSNSSNSIIYDLGSIKTINKVYVSAAAETISGMLLQIAFSQDNITYANGLIGNLTPYDYTTIRFGTYTLSTSLTARYIRVLNGSNAASNNNNTFCDIAVGP